MLNRQQSREFDRKAIEVLGIPGIVLMENAGRGCAEALLELGAGDGVVIACGGGNNGGDGFVIARHLFNAGVDVKVILFAAPDSWSGDAATNLRIIEKLPVQIVEFDPEWSDDAFSRQLSQAGRNRASWIVDALLGTGATGALREPLGRVVGMINQLSIKRMAVDIPTGLDCDTGEANPVAVQAHLTCTFIDQKRGFENPSAREFLGHLKVVDIGIVLGGCGNEKA